MKENYDPVTGRSPSDDAEDPYAGFDTLVTTKGPVCLSCGAVILQVPRWAKVHREWHERTNTV